MVIGDVLWVLGNGVGRQVLHMLSVHPAAALGVVTWLGYLHISCSIRTCMYL